MPVTYYSGSEADLQRVCRNAWEFGRSNYGWRDYHEVIFYQFSKAIFSALFEEMKQGRLSATLDDSTPPDSPIMPNDNAPGPWII